MHCVCIVHTHVRVHVHVLYVYMYKFTVHEVMKYMMDMCTCTLYMYSKHFSLTTSPPGLQSELSEVQTMAEQQRHVLGQKEEEVVRLSQAVQEAGARERERQEQGDREHQEDTVSLAMLQKQLSTLSNEKYICNY